MVRGFEQYFLLSRSTQRSIFFNLIKETGIEHLYSIQCTPTCLGKVEATRLQSLLRNLIQVSENSNTKKVHK